MWNMECGSNYYDLVIEAMRLAHKFEELNQDDKNKKSSENIRLQWKRNLDFIMSQINAMNTKPIIKP